MNVRILYIRLQVCVCIKMVWIHKTGLKADKEGRPFPCGRNTLEATGQRPTSTEVGLPFLKGNF
jgi:hypothetical protein